MHEPRSLNRSLHRRHECSCCVHLSCAPARLSPPPGLRAPPRADRYRGKSYFGHRARVGTSSNATVLRAATPDVLARCALISLIRRYAVERLAAFPGWRDEPRGRRQTTPALFTGHLVVSCWTSCGQHGNRPLGAQRLPVSEPAGYGWAPRGSGPGADGRPAHRPQCPQRLAVAIGLEATRSDRLMTRARLEPASSTVTPACSAGAAPTTNLMPMVGTAGAGSATAVVKEDV